MRRLQEYRNQFNLARMLLLTKRRRSVLSQRDSDRSNPGVIGLPPGAKGRPGRESR